MSGEFCIAVVCENRGENSKEIFYNDIKSDIVP